MVKTYAIFVILIISIVLSGCRNEVLEKENDEIKIIEGADQIPDIAIDENIEKEFDDNLDQALDELEEIENI